jgi:hypothetical protein
MQPRCLLFLTGLGCFSLVACAWFSPQKKLEPNPADSPKLIGRIASIPADRRFVLIQSYGKWAVETGSVMITRGPDARTANLLATGEKLGQFAAADLQSGTLEVGDAVFSLPPAPPPPPTTPTTPTQPPPKNPPPSPLPSPERPQKTP